ncbi:MAG: VOC family protein [Planctomycetia bacterium]|nr:VOC family protein [Planctomycetia bacterium]
MLSTIGTVVVFVTDMARAKRFYAGTLGLPVRRDFGGWVELGTHGATLALHDGAVADGGAGHARPGGPRVQVSFEVASVGRVVASLRGEGVRCSRDPVEIAPGRHVANFTDPDGNELSVAGGA